MRPLWHLFGCSLEHILCLNLAFTDCLNNQTATAESFRQWSIKGRFLSKKAGACFPEQTRAILPLPCTLMIVDTILAVRVASHLDSLPPPRNSLVEAAKKHRSTTDVIFAAGMAVEKGMDNKS